jgi:Tfp pilus assembly protein PilN
MGKNLKSYEVIDDISRKVALKLQLRVAKSENDQDQIKFLTRQISKIDKHLHSMPLAKT